MEMPETTKIPDKVTQEHASDNSGPAKAVECALGGEKETTREMEKTHKHGWTYNKG